MICTDPYPDLVEQLVAESVAAFAQVQAQHPDEHFYGFGFVSAALFVYWIPVANSEETWDQRIFKRMFSSMQAALPRIGQQIFPHAAHEVIIDVESEVNFYAVGLRST